MSPLGDDMQGPLDHVAREMMKPLPCTYTASEHRAALALFAREAAEHWPIFDRDVDDQLIHAECSCGITLERGIAWLPSWQQHILSLADPQALTEHDAALQQRIRELQGLLKEWQDQYQDLEADNAALREQIGIQETTMECYRNTHEADTQIIADLEAQIASAEANAYRRCASELCRTGSGQVDPYLLSYVSIFNEWADEAEKQKAEAKEHP
jgi:hypothetical protein